MIYRSFRLEEEFKSPGQLLKALLKERGWEQKLLAHILDIDEGDVSRLINDRKEVDAPMALLLEEVFLVPAERFLELQKSFDLAKARIIAQPDPKRATRAQLFGGLPVSEMIKRGWIIADDLRDERVESELTRFFGTNRIEDIEVLPHAAKKTEVNVEATPAQLAWLYRVRQIANGMMTPRYSTAAVDAAIQKLSTLRVSVEAIAKVPRILVEAGIRFVIAEALPGSKIDGVCFWLDDQKPVIGMTLRFDRIDNFWFVLRHECEHVRLRHGRTRAILDIDMEGRSTVEIEERDANAAAAEFCVPQKSLQAFIARKAPFYYEHDILGFAKTIGVHPGLVAGQLRRHLGRYDLFGNHVVKVRSKIVPNAFVDGWGNVAPVD